jgi:DinB superfamily
MPTPTPPKPGEEPTNERELYRFHFRRLIGWYVEALDALPPEAYSWRPPAPATNSLATMMSHVASSAEWWVLSCVGRGPLERDRDAEFAAESDWPAMRARLQRWLAAAEQLLEGMGPEELQAISRHPAGGRMNRRCLMHTVEHLGLHLGHLELTVDWWKGQHGGTLAGEEIAAG